MRICGQNFDHQPHFPGDSRWQCDGAFARPQRTITLTPAEYDWLVARLEEAPTEMPRLRALLETPWDWRG